MQATTEPISILRSEGDLQLRSDGTLRHLLTLNGLDRSLLIELLDHSERFVSPIGTDPTRNRSLVDRTVANLFFEPSTRKVTNGVAVHMAILDHVSKGMTTA